MNTETTSLTRSLARFVADPGLGVEHDGAYRIAKIGLIDTVATTMAGRNENAVRIVHEYHAQQRGQREAPLLFAGALLPSGHAAYVNAVAGHALDYDDVSLSAHTSVVLVPALLAEGHRRGASGLDVLRAYAVGYEVWADLFAREKDHLHVKGWHPTGVFGTVAAAAAVASLAKLPAEQAQTALAIAASMASGLVANFGTMTKPLHAGKAAANAIEAVRLAEAGFTAAPDALEHHAGFLAALSPTGRVDRTRPFTRQRDRLRLESIGLSVKRYPVCYSCHRVIDATLGLVEQDDLAPADITKVDVRLGTAQASMLRNHTPQTALEAKFSIEFAVASSIVARRVGLGELTDAFVRQAPVQALFAKVATEVYGESCPVDPTFGFADRVRITCADGRVLDSGDIRFPRGNAQNPLDPSELRQKFLDCVAHGGNPRDGASLYDQLAHFEQIPDIRALFG